MASALMRRSAWAATAVTIAAIASPLIGHAAAAGAPQFDPSNSTPGPGQSVIAGSETLTAAFDQPVTGDQNSFKVFEVTSTGARGAQLPGTVTFDTGMPPVTGPGDTVTWKPQFTLVVGEYEAVLNVNGFNSSGAKDPSSVGTADYNFYVAGKGAPTNLSAPAFINNQNDSAVPFKGTAAPGLTITVTVTGSTAMIPGNSTKNTAVVPTCNTAPSCPWEVDVDVTTPAGGSMFDDGTLTWNAAGSEPESTTISTATSPDQNIAQDTMAPSTPTAQTPTISADSTQVTIPGATDSDSSTVGYTITITDPESHTVVTTPAAGTDSSRTMAKQVIDVTSLDDGKLTVHIDARDAAGNLSGDFGGSSPPTVQKNVGAIPNLSTSTFTTPAGNTTFLDAEQHAIQPPSTIDIEFTEPVIVSYKDNTKLPPVTHSASACIASTGGNCIVGLSLAASPSGNGYIATVPKGSTVGQGTYELQVTWLPKNSCGDVNPPSSDTCKAQTDVVRKGSTAADYSPATQAAPLQWTVDTTPPTISVTEADSPITGATLQSAVLAGTVDNDVNVVQLSIVSSNDKTHTHVATASVTNTGGWQFKPVPLSGVVDGVLTLTLKATDGAGLSSTATKQVVLSGLGLHVLSGDSKALVTWSKPTLANGATPTYTLTYRDQTVANSTAQTLHPSSSATSATLGLTNGHSYGVTLSATDANGNGPVAAGTATPKSSTALSISSSARTITYGTTVVLSGRLIDSHGYGVGGKRLSLFPVYAGGRKGGAAHPTTDTHGRWSFSTKPIANASYDISFAGDSGFGSSISSVAETVKAAIRITSVTAKNSSHTTAVRIAGTVGPNEHGRHVYIYEIRSGKSVRIAMVTLSSSSTFSYTHAWSRGTHVVFARFYSQNGVTGNNSPTVKFSRT